VGPGAVLDAVVKRKIPSPRRKSNPRIPIVQPVAQRYTDSAITVLQFEGVPGRTHKAYFPTAQISSPVKLVLLISYFFFFFFLNGGNINV
jgi:hypothetical protein